MPERIPAGVHWVMGFGPPRIQLLLVAMLIAVSATSRAQPESGSETPSAPTQAGEQTEPVLHEVIENRTRHWSMALPPGWVLAPQETVDAIDEEMSRLAPEKGFRCVAMLWPEQARGTAGPHIQVHAVLADSRGVSLDEMEKALAGTRELAAARERERETAAGKAVRPEETPPSLDRERRRIVSSGRLVVPPLEPGGEARIVRFVSTGLIGKDEVTKLIFYAPDAEFDALRPTYDAVVDSFAYEAGWGYSPASSRAPFGSGLPLGAGGLIVAGLIVVSVKLLWRRKKPKPRPGPFGL